MHRRMHYCQNGYFRSTVPVYCMWAHMQHYACGPFSGWSSDHIHMHVAVHIANFEITLLYWAVPLQPKRVFLDYSAENLHACVPVQVKPACSPKNYPNFNHAP